MAIEALQQTDRDTISRQAAFNTVTEYRNQLREIFGDENELIRVVDIVKHRLIALPSTQPEVDKDTNVLINDCISRQAAKLKVARVIWEDGDSCYDFHDKCVDCLDDVPSAQPEPISDAYMKAVWTWLLNYQIKAAELKGRYTPYEVLSWVANDWRKEHECK